MKFTVNRLKKLALLLTLPLLATAILNSMPTAQAGTALDDFDAATVFKAKCAMCHGAKAEKKFDSTVPDEQLFQIVMKGKKGAAPPFMPEYESKGLTADQAKALIAHMKQLRVAAAELPK
jgi:cytochrome c553